MGSALAQHLYKLGYPIAVSSRSHKGNILSDLDVSRFIIDLEANVLSLDTFLESEILIINIPLKNVDAYQKIIPVLERSNVKKVLFVSSTSVYQNCNQSVDESDQSLLGSSIWLDIENLFRLNDSFESTIIRFCGLIGYDRNPAKFITKSQKTLDPKTPVNMIHKDDCIGILTEIIKQELWGETFNACAPIHPSKEDFYTKAALVSQLPKPAFDYSLDEMYKIIDSTKLTKALKYRFKYPNLLDIVYE